MNMATIKAYCGYRNGGSGVRTVKDAAEAEKILRGGYGVTNVRLENESGEEVGRRWEHYEFGEKRWIWSYEPVVARCGLPGAVANLRANANSTLFHREKR